MRLFFVLFCALCFANISAFAEDDGEFTPRLERAEEILAWLQGEWKFVLGENSGTRIVTSVYPDHLISWHETFDTSDLDGRGFIGFDPGQDQFYSFAVHNVAGEYGLMAGKLDKSGNEIIYMPVYAKTPYQVVWRREADDRFTYTLKEPSQDGEYLKRWTAEFTRNE